MDRTNSRRPIGLRTQMIVHLLTNNFVNDSRVLRAVSVGTSLDLPVMVLARHSDGLPMQSNESGADVRRLRLRSADLPRVPSVQLIKYSELSFQMIAHASRVRPSIVHAHDLATLWIGYTIAKRTGAALLYDSHELWSSVLGETANRPRLFRPALKIEQLLAPKADAVVTVSEGIASAMAERLKVVKPTVVRNIPEPPSEFCADSPELSPLRTELGIPEDAPIVLYQGGLSEGRGLHVLMEAMGLVAHGSVRLVVLGSGPLLPELKAIASSLGAMKARVHFVPAVPSHMVLDWTRGATVGVHPILGGILNHELCLPNKLFEYIHGGLPVIVSDLPEMGQFVRSHDLGAVFVPGSSLSLAREIDALLSNPDALHRHRRAVRRAAQEVTWARESERLRDLYVALGAPGPASHLS